MTEPPIKIRTLHEAQTLYGNLTWDVAKLFPVQGAWSEWEYLDLRPNQIIEYDHGYVEIHDVPKTSHQRILLFLYDLLSSYVRTYALGVLLVAPLRVKLWEEKYREPDIVFMLAANKARCEEEYWIGADLVVEVVSEGDENRHRDLVTKREDYARGGIPEYWIVDADSISVSVLRLKGTEYTLHGEFRAGETVTSLLLPGFEASVEAVFAAAKL